MVKYKGFNMVSEGITLSRPTSLITEHVYCISCYFREGFIFANFASQTLAKISTSIHVYL